MNSRNISLIGLTSKYISRPRPSFFLLIFFVNYLRRRLASGEGIVSLGVRLSRCVCVRRISLDGEGNALYPVLSSFQLCSCCTLLAILVSFYERSIVMRFIWSQMKRIHRYWTL